MKKGNWKKIMSILAATIGTTFVITSLVAKKEIGKSQYKDESNQMNPLEGKKVVFIENDDEIENADGVRGHLEAIGDSDYKVGFYEKYIKRGFDIVLSFGGGTHQPWKVEDLPDCKRMTICQWDGYAL